MYSTILQWLRHTFHSKLLSLAHQWSPVQNRCWLDQREGVCLIKENLKYFVVESLITDLWRKWKSRAIVWSVVPSMCKYESFKAISESSKAGHNRHPADKDKAAAPPFNGTHCLAAAVLSNTSAAVMFSIAISRIGTSRSANQGCRFNSPCRISKG